MVTSCKRRNALIGVLKKRRNADANKHRLIGTLQQAVPLVKAALKDTVPN